MRPFSLLDAPEDVLTRVLTLIPLPALPPTILAIRQTCHAADTRLESDTLWHALLYLLEPNGASSSMASRRSERLVLTSEMKFVAQWRQSISRAELLHHAIACAGQDSQDLSVKTLRRLHSKWGPCRFIDRASPVYNATILMEVCRARGVREAVLVAVANELCTVIGADPSARPPGKETCTPLIIAASRGLPRLTSFLLRIGADPRPHGTGRFRLCGRSQTLFGCYSALEWTSRLLKAEEDAGIEAEHRGGLERCNRLLAACTCCSSRAVPEQ